MTIEKIDIIFDDASGESTSALDINANHACMQAGLSVLKGSVSAAGKLCEEDEDHELAFMNIKTGDIQTTADEGIYTILGAEMLYSITFTAAEDSIAVAKYLY